MKRAFLIVLLLARVCFAGGPLRVAGVSGFQTGLAGTPITWADGQVVYYTDQGGLSPILPSADADQLVADAFSRWTSVPTAALTASRGGGLDEDVSGSNISGSGGALTLPTDLRAGSGKPVAVVYDRDGAVFDALMGNGAGAEELCNTNSVYGTADDFSADAHFAHALIFINGNCAKSPAQIPLLRFRLIRLIGQILGLDYSQLNDNVYTESPPPTVEDYAGYPVMHPLGLLCGENACRADADQLRMDDRAAISRLYPVTLANVGSFSGKHVFDANTARISGTVSFARSDGTPGQGMQGVNVVARLVDPNSDLVSRRYSASSVSGFLFSGDAGNPIYGYHDGLGQPLDRFGSNEPSLAGFFDLAGLEIPDGYSQGTYEISVEPVSPLYSGSTSVGPYKGGPVAISGIFDPVRVTVPKGGSVVQDIVMQGVPQDTKDDLEPSTFNAPATLPSGGSWFGSLSGYGDRDYFSFHARANRTFTFDVTALDENGRPSTSKARPVLGLWSPSDPEDVSPARANYFNTAVTGLTRLEASTFSSNDYKLGIMDDRGDGRPDFLYQARLFYADDIAPARASAKGGTQIAVTGMGFGSNNEVRVGSVFVTPMTISPEQIVFSTPPLADGAYSISVTNFVTGARAEMENVLLVGAQDARLVFVSGSNPQVPIGTQAPNPMRVKVVDANNGDPVSGASVRFAAPASAGIVGCSQQTCTVYTDESGMASAYILVKSAGASVITASLPGGNSVSTTVNGIVAELEITAPTPSLYVSSGAEVTLTTQALVVANGLPVANKTVNFLLNSGTATISPSFASTGSNGIASTSITVNGISKDVNISACVAPGNTPCRTLIVHPVSATALAVQKITGDQQLINVGQSFSPVTVRVADGSANPVAGATVLFMVDVYRAGSDAVRTQYGDLIVTTQDDTVVLSTSRTTVTSDNAGLATLSLSIHESQPVRVIVRAAAGVSETVLNLQSVWSSSGTPASSQNAGQAQGSVVVESPAWSKSRQRMVVVPEPVLPADSANRDTPISEEYDDATRKTGCKVAGSSADEQQRCEKRRRVWTEKPSTIPRTAK